MMKRQILAYGLVGLVAIMLIATTMLVGQQRESTASEAQIRAWWEETGAALESLECGSCGGYACCKNECSIWFDENYGALKDLMGEAWVNELIENHCASMYPGGSCAGEPCTNEDCAVCCLICS
jgi:hypothetical protein